MLVGYVSDERFVAIADVTIEFERDGETVACVPSTARGKVIADIEPGDYRVTLVKSGFGSKSVEMTADPAESVPVPAADRLPARLCLAEVGAIGRALGIPGSLRRAVPALLAPVRAGERVVKILGWFDEHGPRAVMQITPDGDYTQTGVEWNKRGYGSRPPYPVRDRPERSGLYYLEAETQDAGEFFSFPWIVAPDVAVGADRGRRRDERLERLQQLRRAEQLRQFHRASARAGRQRPPGSDPVHRFDIRRVEIERRRIQADLV